MTSYMPRLLEDHRNLIRLLRFLREEIGHYDDPDIETDLHSVLSALDYISAYAETFHHPLEDAAFDRMELRGIGQREIIDEIRGQHEELELETKELKRLLELVFDDHPVPVEQIQGALNKYLDSQFAHMEAEERDIFPVMEKSLSDDDWRQILTEIDDHVDPLFSKAPIESYVDLGRRLGLA